MKLNRVTADKDKKGILRLNLSARTEDPAAVKKYRAEMARLCREYGGIGLAANQAGLELNMFLAMPGSQILPCTSPELFINPSWAPAPDSPEYDSVEGCLSLPGKRYVVRRYLRIEASWLGSNGHLVKRTLKGFGAKVFQHECDHLQGLTLQDTGVEAEH